MMRYYGYDGTRLVEREGLETSTWINIVPPFDPVEIESLSRKLEIPLDYLTDSLDIDERSRYETEEDIRLIVVNSPVLNEIDQENEAIYITVPVGIILTPEHIITITASESPVLKKFLENRVKRFDPTRRRLFVLQFFEQNVLRFLECLKKLNLKRNLIEQELYDSSRNMELKHLLRIEKSLVYFVNSLSANELLMIKMKRTDLLRIGGDEFLEDLFEDTIIDCSQALEMANVHTNILSGTMEAYASIVSNNVNFFIQRLTLITIILMVPTLVASFYGMNVHLPMEEYGGAFYILICISLIIILLLVWFFRRKKFF